MGNIVDAHPLTPSRFADLERLFAAKGCSFARSCWCMDYRVVGRPKAPAGVAPADYRRAMLRELADNRPAPGLIGYNSANEPVGWVAVGPRDAFVRLARSPVMGPVDDLPVWSIVCFVVPSDLRGSGIARALINHAIAYARKYAAVAIEAYPIDKKGRRAQPQWLWHGTRSMFDAAGFEEVARRKPERPIMRLDLRWR
jgi:GNAT superfamily N-acetyltransferase